MRSNSLKLRIYTITRILIESCLNQVVGSLNQVLQAILNREDKGL